MINIVYATTNPAKFAEVSKLFAPHRIILHSPQEYGIQIDIEETGNTLEANATLKAETYRDQLPDNCIVLGDDTGVEIDALHGEPGIKVRRWKGYSMTDEEIISYTLERLHGVSSAQRGAQFRTVIAVSYKHHPTRTFSGIYRGVIRTQPLATREAGFPFRSLFRGSHPTHRENAAKSVLPYLSTLMN